MRRLVVSLAVATVVFSTGGATLASPGDLALVSASQGGVKANDESLTLVISANGDFVGFSTVATNLDPRDTDLERDVYVKDLTTGRLTLVSTSASGMKGNGASDFPSFSADGTKIAFSSTSTNLTAHGSAGIFVKDLTTGEIILASTSDTGRPDFGILPSLSADGSRLAFQSESTVLDPGDTDELTDVYVKDLETGDLVLASTSDAGVKGVGGLFGSRRPFLSADGNRVGFLSDDVNLDPADRDDIADSYVKDLTSGDLMLISTSDTGVKGNNVSGRPTLSADATEAVFASFATNLDPQKTIAGSASIYLKNLATGELTLVSVTETGRVLAGNAGEPVLSADGTRFTFGYGGKDADPADADSFFDVYLKDLVTGDLGLLSVTAAGVKGNGDSSQADMAADATRVAFRSKATNLHPADPDSVADIYAKEPGGVTPPPGNSADLSLAKSDSPDPVLAGQVLTYQLTATNAGPSAATNVLVLDELPPSATFLSATASQGSCNAAGGRVTCRLGNLTAGGSATVTIQVRPTQAGPIANRATVQADEPDPDAFDNAAEARTTVQPAADLALTLRDTPDPVRVRDRLTYEIVVANRGPSMAGTVTLVDSLPRDVRLVTASASSGSCSATRETVTCTAFGLDADSTLTATIVVTPKRTGTITNTASVTANVADPVLGNNAATESTAVR